MTLTPAASLTRYNAVAMTLHWGSAALLNTNNGLAWWFNTLHGPAALPPVQAHKAIGVTILSLSILRLGWRLVSPPPPLPAGVADWERLVSGAAFVLFYVVMIGMPLTGWAMVSSGPALRVHPISVFGLFDWPAIAPLSHLDPAPQKQARELFEAGHGALAKLAYALIVLHVAAALRHQFIRRDDVMARMVPFLRGRGA